MTYSAKSHYISLIIIVLLHMQDSVAMLGSRDSWLRLWLICRN